MKPMISACAVALAVLLAALGPGRSWAQDTKAQETAKAQETTKIQETATGQETRPRVITAITRDSARAGTRSSGSGTPYVMAGDDVTVALSWEPASGRRYQARFRTSTDQAEKPVIVSATLSDKPAISAKPSAAVRLTVPAVSSTTPVSRFVQIAEMNGDADVVVSEPRALQIAPPSSAVIHTVSPTTLAFDSVVKVTGTGFFAPPEEIKFQIGEIKTEVLRVSANGDWFSARVPHEKSSAPKKADESFWDQLDLEGKKYDAGKRGVTLTVWDVPAELRATADDGTPITPIELTVRRPRGADYRIELLAGAVTLVTGLLLFGLVYGLYRTLNRRRSLVGALLLDPETQTYSLARAQFFWWLTIIAVAYLFLFFAQGIYQGQWRFPSLQGFAITFMISLGTLLLAQATTSMKGSKGAGLVHPTPADLIVHGGVLAPERVQQVVWTVLIGLGFLWIVVKTYATSDGLPDIPPELLTLMGLSSAGYLGGKLARKPGPVVQRLEVADGSVVLKIFGQHLSVTPRILVDSVEIARENIAVLEPDPDDPNEFAKGLKVTVPEATAKTRDEWFSQARVVAIINADSQRAEWQLEMPTVTSIDVAKADESGQRLVTVTGLGLDAGAVLLAPGTKEEVPLTPAAGDPPTKWTATVKSWPAVQTDVTIRSASQARVRYTWTPPGSDTSAAKPQPPAPPQDPNAQIDAHRKETDEAAEGPGTADTHQ